MELQEFEAETIFAIMGVELSENYRHPVIEYINQILHNAFQEGYSACLIDIVKEGR